MFKGIKFRFWLKDESEGINSKIFQEVLPKINSNQKFKDVKNPIFEEDLKKILDDIWKNRTNINYSKLNLLEKIANYKGGKF